MISWWLGSIIIIVLALLINGFIEYKNYVEEELNGAFASIILLMLMISLIFGSLFSFLNSEETNIRYKYINKVLIFSLEDNINIKGQYGGMFILGYGSVDSNLYYYALIGNDEDGYIVNKYNSEKTHIVPKENIQPYYIEKIKIYDEKYKNNFVFGVMFKPLKTDYNVQEVVRREIHLPKQHIKQNYNIDLQ